MEKPVILCVDADTTALVRLRDELKLSLGATHSIELAQDAEEALRLAQEWHSAGIALQVALTAQQLPATQGDGLLTQLHQLYPALRSLLTGPATATQVGAALQQGGLVTYLAQPWQEKDLPSIVSHAVAAYEAAANNEHKLQLAEQLAVDCRAMAAELSTDGLVEKALRHAITATGAEKGMLIRYHNGQRMQALALLQQDGAYNKTELANPPSQFFAKVLVENKPITLGKAYQDSRWADEPYFQSGRVKSAVGLPVHYQRQLVALLYLEAPTNYDHFTPLHARYLAGWAEQLGNSLYVATQLAVNPSHASPSSTSKPPPAPLPSSSGEAEESLLYARRIQQALMPEVAVLRRYFPESYVYYASKEIVSGDFYWFSEANEQFYVAVADCTGHGIPGAYLSVLGCTQLTEAVHHRGLLSTSEILAEVDQGVRKHILQDGQQQPEEYEGIEVALCRFNHERGTMEFSGANLSGYLLRGSAFHTLEHDKGLLGGNLSNAGARGFTSRTVALMPGDTFYLFTDGIPDQLGGDQGRKLTRTRLLDFLLSICEEQLQAQQNLLTQFIDQWRGEQRPTDDMLLLALRV